MGKLFVVASCSGSDGARFFCDRWQGGQSIFGDEFDAVLRQGVGDQDVPAMLQTHWGLEQLSRGAADSGAGVTLIHIDVRALHAEANKRLSAMRGRPVEAGPPRLHDALEIFGSVLKMAFFSRFGQIVVTTVVPGADLNSGSGKPSPLDRIGGEADRDGSDTCCDLICRAWIGAVGRVDRAVPLVCELEGEGCSVRRVRNLNPQSARAVPRPVLVSGLRTTVFAFGRMNPPSLGHEEMIEDVHRLSKACGADHLVVLGGHQDRDRNPLDGACRLGHLQRMFPDTNFAVCEDPSGDPWPSMTRLYEAGTEHLIIVTGADRVDFYLKRLEPFNGAGEGRLFSFKVVSLAVGGRPVGEDRRFSVSASQLRKHAIENRFSDFRDLLPYGVSRAHALELFRDVRIGLGCDPA